VFLVAIAVGCSTQSQSFTVVFYNAENLFDYEDDPDIDDAEFLPGSRIPWTPERYEVKLDHLVQVLSSINENELPALIGLCEVENYRVLQDLTGSFFSAPCSGR